MTNDKPESGKPTGRRDRTVGQLSATAYHEAGHAFADWKFHFKIKQLTIVPGDGSLGTATTKYFQFRQLEYGRLDDGKRIGRYHDRIVTLLAGEEAQRRFDPKSIRKHHGAGDNDSVKELLMRLHPDAEEECRYAFRYLLARTRNLVSDRRNWRQIEDPAKALLERRTLTGEKVNDVIQASRDAQIKERQALNKQPEICGS
jgi:ATP-dependent Zn protease